MARIVEAPGAKVRKKRNWKLRLVLFLVGLPALLLAAYTWFTLNYAYSTGQRSGYVQKISKKGLALQDPGRRTGDDHGPRYGTPDF